MNVPPRSETSPFDEHVVLDAPADAVARLQHDHRLAAWASLRAAVGRQSPRPRRRRRHVAVAAWVAVAHFVPALAPGRPASTIPAPAPAPVPIRRLLVMPRSLTSAVSRVPAILAPCRRLVSAQCLTPARGGRQAAARHLAAAGLVAGTSGNVSAPRRRRSGRDAHRRRSGRARRRRTSPSSTLTASPRRQLAPTSEVGLHLGVYERYGAGAVVHTHAPMATALSCVLDELPCVHY